MDLDLGDLVLRMVAAAVIGALVGISFIVRNHEKNVVEGLTTAATVWATAAFGIACALGAWTVVIAGTVVRPNGDPGADVEDNTATDVEIASGGLRLEIVGINGAAGDGSNGISPGDTVTYELTYELGTGDFEDLQLDAFLRQ